VDEEGAAVSLPIAVCGMLRGVALVFCLALNAMAIDTSEIKKSPLSLAPKSGRDSTTQAPNPKRQTEPSAAKSLESEVNHLFAYLEHSGCRFERNGKWHTSQEAAAHLRKKFAHLRKRGDIADAADFIAKGATGSSMSGKPYRVQCGDAQPVPSATWLGDELARYRRK
jgi:Family of unknown function (DUF5329)